MVTVGTQSLLQDLANVCERNHVRRLRQFGSTVRGEERPDSDVDLLVEYEPGYTKSLESLLELESSLQDLFGGRVIDLVDPELLHWFIRDSVLASARTIYER
jgi:predicted nucleotidyltransferase